MKNLDTLSKRILVIAISITMVVLSCSALFFSINHAFATPDSKNVNTPSMTNELSYDAVASEAGIVVYSKYSGSIVWAHTK